jgi:undecaprenyl-diphosphatase
VAIGRLTEPSSPSFPSRHAATAFAGATTLGLRERELLPALVALAAAVAGSRVYLGLHYRSDVAAGAAVGTAVTAADRLRSSAPRR